MNDEFNYRSESKNIENLRHFKKFFDIVNNISLTLNIKVKNKSSHANRSNDSDRISVFNQEN